MQYKLSFSNKIRGLCLSTKRVSDTININFITYKYHRERHSNIHSCEFGYKIVTLCKIYNINIFFQSSKETTTPLFTVKLNTKHRRLFETKTTSLNKIKYFNEYFEFK